MLLSLAADEALQPAGHGHRAGAGALALGPAGVVARPGVLAGRFPLADFDVWWHLRTGQLILDTHTVPCLDLFTYTNATRPGIYVYWLYQVGLALLYRAGGASALVLLKASVGAGIVAPLHAGGAGRVIVPGPGRWPGCRAC